MIIEKELSDNKNIRKVYDNYNQKVILNVINPKKQYKFFKITTLLWFIMSGFIICGIIYQLSDYFGKTDYIILNTIFIIMTILGVGFAYTKIYFEPEKMVIKNLFKKKYIVDLNLYPRIFTKSIKHESMNKEGYRYSYKAYYLYFQQNEKKIKIRLYFNNIKKIIDLLENLEIIELEKISEEKRFYSASEKEMIIENYIKENRGKRVIGVKDKKQKIILKNAPTMIIVVLWITFFIVLGMGCYFNSAIKEMGSKTWGATLIELSILFIIIIAIIAQYIKTYIKISYPTDDLIKVNTKKFNYKENIVTISFFKSLQRETIRYGEKEDILNEYIFQISDDIGNFVRNELGQSNTKKLKEFLENIEFY